MKRVSLLLLFFACHVGFAQIVRGVSGSVADLQYLAHKPHPTSIIKEKALKDILFFLDSNKLL